ncbi:hypothetical protein JW930_00025 [Candidatus Woesearchaeota archaeon]|nr:hypothetical protein [Candidatus Woesearchaeota archaeon]
MDDYDPSRRRFVVGLGAAIAALLFGGCTRRRTSPTPTPERVPAATVRAGPTATTRPEPTQVPPTPAPSPTTIPRGYRCAYDGLVGVAVYIGNQSLYDFYSGNNTDDLVRRIADSLGLSRNEYLGMLVAAENYFAGPFREHIQATGQSIQDTLSLEGQLAVGAGNDFCTYTLDNNIRSCYAFIIVPNIGGEAAERLKGTYDQFFSIMVYGEHHLPQFLEFANQEENIGQRVTRRELFANL